MKSVARAILNRWVLLAIGLVVMVVLIWWVGPMISISNLRPFEAEWVRWIQIAVLFLTPVARVSWKFISARRANAALASGLVAAEVKADPATGEVAQLRRRFEDAMGLLRRRHFGSEKPSLWTRIASLGSQQYLYDLPWYIFIGAPGAGKTTALINSGLRFPLADRLGKGAVRGVGGTRDCDWWFTDEAVFLDTAGRYTTQQSHQELDAGAWKGFLQLLKKSRSRRPINGVLVTMSVDDLLRQSDAEREALSLAIRARVRELYDELGVRFPIYALVTKSDLLAGFSEFFAALGRDERGQVWGFSLPYGQPGLDAPSLASQLDALEQRLYARLPERLEEERDPARRALLYGFPQQFALLRDRLIDFVEATFAPTQFESAALLRGVYFTSGTQEGSPIDRVMGALARGLGLERKLLPTQNPSGRSYFLTRLLREVVFPEGGLTGLDLRGERRRWWIQRAAIGAAVAVLVVVTAAWWISYRRNQEYIAEVAAQFAKVKESVAAMGTGGRSELPAVMSILTSVRALPEAGAAPDGNVRWTQHFGLYQGGKVEAATRAAYRRMLEGTLLPSLTAYLAGSLRQDTRGNQDDAYEALKTYVMLYDQKHFKRPAVWNWYEKRVDRLLPRSSPEQQKALKTHFDTLYERGWVEPGIPRNDELLAQARAALTRDSLPQRIYGWLKREAAPELRDFSVLDKVGPRAMLVFERANHEPLTRATGVPAFYTKDGYYKQFAKHVDLAAAQLAEEERWILGASAGALAGAAASVNAAEPVKELYLKDYQNTWREFINSLSVRRDRDLTKVIDLAGTLSAPDSPLKSLVKAIDKEVTLSVPPEGEQGVAGAVAGKAQQYTSKARQIITGAQGDSPEKRLVDDQFDDIHRLAAGSPPAIDTLVQQLNEYYQWLVAAKVGLDGALDPPPSEAANKLRAEAARQPEPFRSMLLGLVERGTGAVSEKVRQRKLEEQRQGKQG